MYKKISLLLMSFLVISCGGGGNNTSSTNNSTVLPSASLVNRTSSAMIVSSPQVIGINFSEINNYNPQWMFIDVFKTSKPWTSAQQGNYNDGRILNLDNQGWVKSLEPNQYARTLMFNNLVGAYPSGKYIVLYEGEGKIEYKNAAKLIANSTTINGVTKREIIEVDSNKMGGIELLITQTNPSNYIKNIRIITPGGICKNNPRKLIEDPALCSASSPFQSFEENYQTRIFHPYFLSALQPFRAFRFMDFMSTNASTQATWENRPKLEDATWAAGKGVPLEIMIKLANRFKASPWFNIPHMATDDYVRNFATLVKTNLKKDLISYVEYSNEVWNIAPGYEQSGYAQVQGHLLKLDPSPNPDPTKERLYYYAYRSKQIFDQWEQVFGNREKFRRILGTQSANTGITKTILSYKDAASTFDFIGVAPYFRLDDLKDEQQALALINTPNSQIFTKINARLTKTKDEILAQDKIAKQYGMGLIAYEGGQFLVAKLDMRNNEQLTNKLISLNRDPAMKNTYVNYLNIWHNLSPNFLFHHNYVHTPTGNGSWGLLENILQNKADAPKYQGIQTFLKTLQGTTTRNLEAEFELETEED